MQSDSIYCNLDKNVYVLEWTYLLFFYQRNQYNGDTVCYSSFHDITRFQIKEFQ